MFNVPVIGIVENMSGLVCPHCGKEVEVFSGGMGKRVDEEMDVPFLGSVPMDPGIT
jgi:Mrp family chromosome partitioning ATPase